MHVVKVIEVIAESTEGWEQAAQDAVTHAAQTVRNIRSVWVQDLQAIVENNKVVKYRLTVKMSFVVEEGQHAGEP
jgi:flavin-binding protein dodecin